MAGNATPQFTKNGAVNSVLVTAANTSSQGGGTIATDIWKAFTADATNGSFVDTVRFIPTATAATTTTATVGRVFLSSVTAGATTSANTFLFAEVTLPAVSADNATIPVFPIDVPLNMRIPAGWTVLVTNHAAPAANTAWRVNVIAGDY
jgi:hypothetical protein